MSELHEPARYWTGWPAGATYCWWCRKAINDPIARAFFMQGYRCLMHGRCAEAARAAEKELYDC